MRAIIAVLLFAGFAFGQAETATQADEEHQRLLGVVPAFGVTNLRDAPAMTAKHKFSLAARQAFDPFVWVSTGIQAAASQAGNEFPEYGQGALGFGKRYGAGMLDSTVGGLASTAFCVVLKQDPRYFRLGEGSAVHRALYSMAQQLSAKSDKGQRQVNWSNVLGMLASSSFSNLYYPKPDRGFGLTMNRFGIGLAWGVTGNLADEFWPDIDHLLFHKKK
jgi:hypothetical protein